MGRRSPSKRLDSRERRKSSLVNRRRLSSIGKASVCRAGGRGFKPRPDQRPGSLKRLVSDQMIASLDGDVKPLALFPSSFCHWSSRRGRRRTSTTVRKEQGWFPSWSTFHTSRIIHIISLPAGRLWGGYHIMDYGWVTVR